MATRVFLETVGSIKCRACVLGLSFVVAVCIAESAPAYYNTSLGRFVSRDPIGYEGSNSNLYVYLRSDRVRFLDPSGLDWEHVVIDLSSGITIDLGYKEVMPEITPVDPVIVCPGGYCIDITPKPQPKPGPRPQPTEEEFYVCGRPVTYVPNRDDCGTGTASACGWYHTDIYSSTQGLIYVGFGGGQRPKPGGGGLPPQPPNECQKLSYKTNDAYCYGYGPGCIIPKKMKWGSPGKLCSQATTADIAACLQAKPKPPGRPGVVNNCQTDCYDAADGCCLGGFHPATIKPIYPH